MDTGQSRAADEIPSARKRVHLARETPRQVGPMLIEPALCRIRRLNGEEVFLQPRVMQVLVAFLRAGEQIVTRDDLVASCWADMVVGDDAINRVISLLRQLGRGIGRDILRLETINKVGYRLLIAQATDAATAIKSPPSLAGLDIGHTRVCVLPFDNMSGDPEQEYFSDGISDDIITDLSKFPGLQVIARNTAFAFKGQIVDIPRLAAQLTVDYVLQGSVRKAGNRIRVSVQLLDGVTGGNVWVERFDRDLDDIFVIQDEISGAIVDALKLRLGPKTLLAPGRRGTERAEAYNYYLMARQYLVGGNQGNQTGGDMIVRLCSKALTIDPGYARAWALMAHAQTYLRVTGGQLDEGLVAADHAIALDFELAEAHAIRARQLFLRGRREEATVEIDIALGLDPESYEVNESAGLLAVKERRFEAAAAFYEKAAALIETSVSAASMLITCYSALANEPQLRRAAERTLERAERAVERDPSNGSAMGYGVGALAVLRDLPRMREWIERAVLVDPTNYNMRYNSACALVTQLGEVDRAIDLLDVFFANARSGDLHHARLDPDLDTIRDDPRLVGLIAAAERRLAAEVASSRSDAS